MNWNDVLQRTRDGNLPPERRVERSEAQWREILNPDAFRVTRLAGTEPAFSSEMCSLFEPGRYSCACCGTVLFDSARKFDSGTGWPSFDAPLNNNTINYFADRSHGMVRVETTCSTCDAHLGHVFPDGPPPGGLRYCMNALALKKV